MGWLFLGGAIAFEIAGSVSLKLSEGLSRFWPSLAVFPLYGVSFSCLALALKTVPLSVAYAIWSAIGIAVIALIGMAWFREPATALKIGAIVVIIAGVIALHLADRLAGA
jgi:small multidrug resistance pump